MSEPKILRLTLKKKWFDLIASGEKKEEYRELKDYWKKRLQIGERRDRYKFFDIVEFRNGYSPDSPVIRLEFVRTAMGWGHAEHGAPDYPVYIIHLGKIIEDEHSN